MGSDFYVLYTDKNGVQRDVFFDVGTSNSVISEDGSCEISTKYCSEDGKLEVEDLCLTFKASPVILKRVRVRNISRETLRIERVDSVNRIIPKGNYRISGFHSGRGGEEAIPFDEPLEKNKILQVTSGRSSRGTHPWMFLQGEDGSIHFYTVAWTGNWILSLNECGEGYNITGGLSDWEFYKNLLPGESMVGADVITLSLEFGARDDISRALRAWGYRWWYPKNDISQKLVMEWNPWWPFTDIDICEKVFLDNAAVAKEMGFDACVLDAGWFGAESEDAYWYDQRGDWHIVNSKRFPKGIAHLAEQVHDMGMKFGIWCEIEALGSKADLRSRHPEFSAKRDERDLGYICFGNPKVQDWAFETLEKMITEYHADWIKLDFNLSPEAGCNRTDHGHGAGDGLYEHIFGYYRVLDRIREKYPEVLLENCSSGGFRTDLGIVHHLHKSFLSDPDYPDHAFQVFWAASDIFHPSVSLHWAYSQNCDPNSSYYMGFNPFCEDIPDAKIDYYVRNTLLKSPGFSICLTELPEAVRARISEHIEYQKNVVAHFIREGELYRLSEQTLRDGSGDRWSLFAYVLENKEKALLFVFRNKNSEEKRNVQLKGLAPKAIYMVTDKDSGISFIESGETLMKNGIVFTDMEEESSKILLFEKRRESDGKN